MSDDEIHLIDVMRPCVENTTYELRENGYIDEEASFIDYYLSDNEEHRSIRCMCGEEFETLEDAFKHLRKKKGGGESSKPHPEFCNECETVHDASKPCKGREDRDQRDSINNSNESYKETSKGFDRKQIPTAGYSYKTVNPDGEEVWATNKLDPEMGNIQVLEKHKLVRLEDAVSKIIDEASKSYEEGRKEMRQKFLDLIDQRIEKRKEQLQQVESTIEEDDRLKEFEELREEVEADDF